MQAEPEAPSGRLSPAKLGERIAARLEEEIRAKAWPAGHYLGHEERLAATYGVSRTVLREAIAIAEWNGSVESRRGREGGLYVGERAIEPAIAVLRNYLYLTGASLGQLLRGRRLIEGEILERAVERIDRRQADRLQELLANRAAPADDRAHLSHLKQIVDSMSGLAGSPLLGMLGGSLRHCYVDRVRTSTLDDGAYLRASRVVAALRLQQIEAILAYDRAAARDLQTRAMDVWEQFAASLPAPHLGGAQIVNRLTALDDDALIYEFVRPAKKAEGVARAIAQLIASRAMPVGCRIGTEADLIAELDVSRRVLREGIRILERFGVVDSGRGKRGGLMVARPRPLSLPAAFQTELTAAGATDEDQVGGLLLIEAVRAIMRGGAPGPDAALASAARHLARDLAANGASDQEAKTRFVQFLAANIADPVACALIGVANDLQNSAGPDRAWPFLARPAVIATLEAIAAGDSFAAPRALRRTGPVA